MNLKQFFGPKTLYFVCGKVYKDNSYANRIVHWFVQQRLPVIPITPSLGIVDLHIDYMSKKRQPDLPTLKVLPSISNALELLNDKNISYGENLDFDSISVNFVTPPTATLQVLKELKNSPLRLKSCWFQPGSWDPACLHYAEQELGLGRENVINDCILVKGFVNKCDSNRKPFTF